MNYLFPNKFKIIGWIVLIPGIILGFLLYFMGVEPEFLDLRFPAIWNGDFLFVMVKTNLFDEIIGVMIIVGALLVGFSREKIEDEFISKIRLESLVWAVYFNYIILGLSILFIYDFAFFNIMMFNMFSLLTFFIIRMKWQVARFKSSANYEE